MRLTILTFHPESLHQVESRIHALLEGAHHGPLELDYVYPSVAFSDSDVWDEAVEADVRARIEALPRDVRILHVKPADFVGQLLGKSPPALVVVAYTHFSERVAMTTNMLALRNFPTLMLGYRS